MKNFFFTCLIPLVISTTLGCSGNHLKVKADNTLALGGCYPLPNCVSSSTLILYNRTSKFVLAESAEQAWPKIKQVVRAMPRTEIVEENDVYIHAKCRSRVFRFVDNLELLLHPEQQTVSVRSSSVIAIFDFFVNRWRIYKLRNQLKELKILE